MGKRKESGTEEEIVIDSPPGSSHKKHKKHKKKHKKKKEGDIEAKPAITLKLKIGGETLGTKSVQKVKKEPLSDDSQEIDILNDSWTSPDGIDGEKKKEDTSDEEKEWLDALEKGNLDDSGMLRKRKDPKLLTARQRALFHGEQEEELLQLPSGYRNVELTEEQVLKRQQRAKKRRQQAHEKREKDKKQTLDRLLKKQESKNKAAKAAKSSKKSNAPKVHYVNNQHGISISVPAGIQFPFTAEKASPPKPKTLCFVTGCSNLKKYSCSKTGVPLCSLQCYKTNLSQNIPVQVV